MANTGGPPVSTGAASETMFQQPGMLTSAPPKAGTFGEPPSGSGSWSPLQAGQQPGNGFNAYYPFGEHTCLHNQNLHCQRAFSTA